MVQRLLSIAAPFALAVVLACSGTASPPPSSDGCTDGVAQACTCSGGASGTATCENGSFGACQCAAAPTPDAGEAADTGEPAEPDDGGTGPNPEEAGSHASTSDAGFGMYMGPCLMMSDCPSGDQCYDFPSKGMFCTHSCMVDTDCEAPSPKCTPKGVCAVPDGT